MPTNRQCILHWDETHHLIICHHCLIAVNPGISAIQYHLAEHHNGIPFNIRRQLATEFGAYPGWSSSDVDALMSLGALGPVKPIAIKSGYACLAPHCNMCAYVLNTLKRHIRISHPKTSHGWESDMLVQEFFGSN